MNALPIDTMRELARSHTQRAKVLWARAERTIDSDVKARILIQANAEQNSAVYWTMRIRNLRPAIVKVTV